MRADVRQGRTCDVPAAEATRQIDDLTSALAARDRFIALVGHELRNALAPMVLLTDQFGTLAEGSQPPGKLLSRVAMLTGNLQKLMSTIGRIVDVADLRRGRLLLDPATIDLVTIVQEVCRDAAREAAVGGAELVIESSGPVIGHWDSARVKQIVSNLVGNAIRYGAGGRIELSVRGTASDGELVIRDHGPGLEPEALPGIFDCFNQTNARRPGGLGVGLWVVKTLCTAMGGTVKAENCPDGGARFSVALPRG